MKAQHTMETKTGRVSTERRSDVRVQDAVALEVLALKDLPAAGDPARPAEASPRVRVANKYDIDGYASVKRDYPAVADYIARLEERIRQLNMDASPTMSQVPTHKVSLSASGMAFADHQLFLIGDMVTVKLTLFPSKAQVQADATVVTVDDVSGLALNGEHTYRVQFTRIADDHALLLRDHVNQLLDSTQLFDD